MIDIRSKQTAVNVGNEYIYLRGGELCCMQITVIKITALM